MELIKIISEIETIKSSLMWDYRIPVSNEDVKKLITSDRRMICSINNQKEFSCGLIPDGKGNYYINLNKELRKDLDLDVGDKVEISLKKDQSEYGMPLPPSFEELLYQDPEGALLFNALTPGKRRSLLYVIGKPKSEQKQLEKGLIVLDYLKEVEGKLDFRELNLAFKDNRFK
jgi:bifunctional DNA-binding transcriptional regulator/antitoxin component of YhaV-PrlF toxin-antitoxin module